MMSAERKEEIRKALLSWALGVSSDDVGVALMKCETLEALIEELVFYLPNEDYTDEFFDKLGITTEELVELKIVTDKTEEYVSQSNAFASY